MELMRAACSTITGATFDRLPSARETGVLGGHLAGRACRPWPRYFIAWAAAREPRHPELLCWGDLARRLPDDAPRASL